MKKISLALAFLLALTAVVPLRTAAAETVMKSEIALVSVTVPTSGRIVLNPYGLAVQVDGETTNEQVASDTMPITNNGELPVVVSARAVGHISEDSSMVFVPAPPQADSTEKEIFVYTEFQSGDGDWTGDYRGDENQILVAEGTSPSQEVLTLEANAEGKFRMFGAASVSPEDPWCGEDEISVKVVFTFTPELTPVDAAAEEEETPEEPEETTEEPVEEPEEPVESPEEPVETPEEPVEPVEPVETPEEPVEPVEPVESPEEPVETPVESPVETPEEPVETPVEPVETGV